jgi:hypothetical protein
MTTLADAKLTALEALTGNTGHTNDLEAEFLVLLGATAGSTIVDQWWEVFDAAAVPAGQFNDRAVAYIVAQVGAPPSDDYNAHWQHYWENVTVGPVGPTPPLLSDLFHWYDFTDPLVLWQDVGGTVPIVVGQDILRVDDKGTEGTPVLDDFPPGAVWEDDLLNGYPGTLSTAGFPPNLQDALWPGASPPGPGVTIFSVGREGYASGFTPSNHYLQAGGPGVMGVEADPTLGEWAGNLTGSPQATGSGRVITLNEWVWNMARGGATNTFEASGTPPVFDVGPFVAPIAGTVTLGQAKGSCMEVLVYGRELTGPEQALVVAYFDAKYGVLPYLTPPASVPDLIHHFDFTENQTVFKNPPANQLAGDGDFIRHVTNLGSDGTPITSASTGIAPIYRTGVVNGLNVASYEGTSKTLDAVVAAGHASSSLGLSMALVFRWVAGPAATNSMAAWQNNLMRTHGARFGQHFVAGAPGNVSSIAPLAGGIWYLGAFAFDGGNGVDRWRWSGELLQTAALGFLTDIPPGSTIEIANASVTIQVGEYAVWDGQLSAAEFDAIFAYADEKYGGLPSPAPLLPPFLPNLHHWWDFTDAATVWADTAAGMPITDGTIIQRVDDKGTAADDLLDAGSGITWHAGVVNGLAVARNTVVQVPSRFTSQALAGFVGGLNGFTYSSVKRHFIIPAAQGIMHAIDNGPSEVTQESGFGSWIEDHPTQGTTVSNKAVVPNEWVSHDVSDGTGAPAGYIQHVSGAVDVTAIQAYQLQAATPVEIFAQSVDGEIGEILVYDRNLSAAELLTLQAYYDAKYAALPHL